MAHLLASAPSKLCGVTLILYTGFALKSSAKLRLKPEKFKKSISQEIYSALCTRIIKYKLKKTSGNLSFVWTAGSVKLF